MKQEEITAKEFRQRLVNSVGKVGLSDAPKKKSKYSSVKTVVDGITFDSKKESEYYKTLLMLQKACEVDDIELQPKFEYKVLYTRFDQIDPIVSKKETYISDFRVTYKNGDIEIVDCKGMRTAIFNRKKKIVEKLFGISIKLV